VALDEHPNVFRFEGRTWVSLAPRDDALEQFRAQRAWDTANAKLQRWWVAITVGAVVGVAATLALGTAANTDPTGYLLLLPLGFGVGAILGALVNKRFNAPEGHHESLPERPTTVQLTQVPSRVARAAPAQATALEIIEWSNRGFVG
jgi:F0F1-type ATP synthase assembly protein I